MKAPKKTPEKMVVDGKIAEFGIFKSPFEEVNLLELDFKVRDRSAPRIVADFRLKEWEHFGIVHDKYYFGMVIFDAKFLGTSFFYAYNRETGEFFQHERTSPGAPMRISRELWHSDCHFRHFGYQMGFDNRLRDGYHRLHASIKGTRSKPAVEVDLRLLEDLKKYEPLVVVLPVDDERPMYTHKTVVPVEGKIQLGDTVIELDPERHLGLMDVQKTFYPYNTFWKWATFGGYDSQGRLLGLNVCNNFIQNDEEFNENCTWVDGRITQLSATRYDFDTADLMKPWRIFTTGGELELEFRPQGMRLGRLNVGVFKSDFNQPFGQFYGTILGPEGEKLEVDGMFGVCEHHLARF